jgi:hypothetical protein
MITDPQFPHGKISPEDEGQLLVAIATDLAKGVIFIAFPKPVKWLGLPLAEAKEIRARLDKHIANLEAGKILP